MKLGYHFDIYMFWFEQPRQDKNHLYRHDEPNEPTNHGRAASFVLRKSPFVSVSTVSRGHPSLVSTAHPESGTRDFLYYGERKGWGNLKI
jgi:hypothetical protein